MPRPGPLNLITDVPGLRVGNATDERVRTGVTALLVDGFWAAGVDVRGGGPGTRETEALAAENLVGHAHAIVLSGGSVFGLAAADGVTAVLSSLNQGLRLSPGSPAIPIVPAAVLHDLSNGGDKAWGLEPPYRRLGMDAAAVAAERFELGSIGAGCGARAGLLPGGLGSSSIALEEGLIVGALVAANPVGSVQMPDQRSYWAWPFELDEEFGGYRPEPASMMPCSEPSPDDSRLAAIGRLQTGANTTLAIVACNADLSSAECKRVAMMAHDGMARAVRPAHTPFDGDTVFALAGKQLSLGAGLARQAKVGRIGAAAADCLARAIARAVYTASVQAPETGSDLT